MHDCGNRESAALPHNSGLTQLKQALKEPKDTTFGAFEELQLRFFRIHQGTPVSPCRRLEDTHSPQVQAGDCKHSKGGSCQSQKTMAICLCYEPHLPCPGHAGSAERKEKGVCRNAIFEGFCLSNGGVDESRNGSERPNGLPTVRPDSWLFAANDEQLPRFSASRSPGDGFARLQRPYAGQRRWSRLLRSRMEFLRNPKYLHAQQCNDTGCRCNSPRSRWMVPRAILALDK